MSQQTQHASASASLSAWRRHWLTSAALAAAVSLTAAPAWAQADDDDNTIIVTAQKREERLQDVPISISVVDDQVLQSTNSRNLAELQGVVPSVYFHGNSGGGRTYVTMRGATGLALNTGDEPVAIYMDDVYLGRGVTIGMTDLLDVGAVEIVRGPQGTLQGRNATAGAILVRSADPTGEFTGQVTASVADPNEVRAQGYISGPIAEDVLTGRLALGFVDEEGWATNTYTGRHIGGAESQQARGVLHFTPGNRFDMRAALDYSIVRNEPAIVRWGATTFSTLPTGALVPAGTATPNVPLPPDQAARILDDYEFYLNPGTFTRVEAKGLGVRSTYSFDGVDLVSITAARMTKVRGLNDSDGLGESRMGYNTNVDESDQWSQELRLQSAGDGPFSWIVGAYYFSEDQFYDTIIYNLQFTSPSRLATQYIGDIETRSYAVFADATLDLTDQFSVTGGVRYTEDEKELVGRIIANNLTTGASPVTNYRPGSQTWDDTSYRVKGVYKPSEDLMFFLGFGRGFRSGGFNPFAVQPAYAPEVNESLELGMKGDFFDGLATVSASVYQNQYENLQLRAGVPTGGAIITNAADSEITGFEFEGTLRPTENFTLVGNLAYTDAVFTSFPRARDIFDQEVDASGNILPRTPEWQYYLSAAYDFELEGDWLLTAEANYRWRDKIYFYFTNQTDPTWQDGAGDELGGRLTLASPAQNWEFGLFGSNLTNSRIINTAAVTFSYPQVGFNKPRVVGVSLRRRF